VCTIVQYLKLSHWLVLIWKVKCEGLWNEEYLELSSEYFMNMME